MGGAKRNPSLRTVRLMGLRFTLPTGYCLAAGVETGYIIESIADALGINRRELRSLSPEEVQRDLGYEVGGVGPVAPRDDIIIIFDENLRNAGKVYFGSGRNTRTLEMQFDDLLRATDGKLYPIVHGSSPEQDRPGV